MPDEAGATYDCCSVNRPEKDVNRSFYNEQRLDERLRYSEEPSKVNAADILVPWVVSHLRPSDQVIDIAGGAGTYASQIVRAAPVTVVGLDISESMVAQRGEDPLLTTNVVGDMETLPFKAETFDAALFAACLHHVPDPLPALREAWRVLRPGGQVFAFEPSSVRARRVGSAPIQGHELEFRMSGNWLADRMRAAGFDVEEMSGRRIAIRALRRIIRAPSLRMFRSADQIDRVLRIVPRLEQLSEIVMLRARKPRT
jgi:ubiquinone/menaquinone biosynthesis C-methylase UbiE